MPQKKIKILFTIPNFDSAGSGKVVYDLIKNLDRTIFKLEICCFHTRGAFFKEIEKLDVKIHVFPFAVNYRPLIIFPLRLIKIVRFFNIHKFDIIHSWHWSSNFSEPLAAKLAGIPFIYTKKSMGWGNKAWKWKSDLSSKIITVNSDMKRFYSRKNLKKIRNIPFGVDTNYYKPSKQLRDALSKDYKIKENDFVIVSVVNLIPVKGVEILIKALIELKDPKIKLLIVGNDKGNYADMLKELAKGIEAIKFVGKVIDVRPYHAIANLFVIPTLEVGEGLPVAPLEAMASGKVVIGSDVSGIKDILQPFPNCLFEPNNVTSLKACILHHLTMESQERTSLATKMTNRVESDFSMEYFIKSHAELYREIGFKN
ncbi:glycosyltransferase [Aegicerativicinus sediminis]|uniref:glycosyltransferase n=1 Tax=Aegicerativicinus sediminis TaxID=2893202 RepID=UPI001E4B9CCC|nr:glycosyltransferase [Aegicerativicinus sediminis]